MKSKTEKRGLCATLYRKDRKSGLKRLIFNTAEVDAVEMKMAQLDIGAKQYWLSWVPVR
jgi:hypothetical protein